MTGAPVCPEPHLSVQGPGGWGGVAVQCPQVAALCGTAKLGGSVSVLTSRDGAGAKTDAPGVWGWAFTPSGMRSVGA